MPSAIASRQQWETDFHKKNFEFDFKSFLSMGLGIGKSSHAKVKNCTIQFKRSVA
jgi:hypothetical protein